MRTTRTAEREACACGQIECVCRMVAGHSPDCRFSKSVLCPVAIECEHGYDVCPICDACNCGAVGVFGAPAPVRADQRGGQAK